MSFIVCPMCGKNSSTNGFDPSSLDLDIYVRSSHGLGRGKGFSWTPMVSILAKGDPHVEAIKDRTLELFQLFIDNDVLTQQEILSYLKIRLGNPKQVEDLTGQLISLKNQLASKNGLIGDLTENLKSCRGILKKRDELVEDLERDLANVKRLSIQKDRIIEDLTQDNVYLKEQVENLTEKGQRLLKIAKNQKRKIESLEEQVEDLAEAAI